MKTFAGPCPWHHRGPVLSLIFLSFNISVRVFVWCDRVCSGAAVTIATSVREIYATWLQVNLDHLSTPPAA